MPHISVVVPVYKAQSCLEELYRRLRDSLSPITEDFEILLVEDCGEDRSWEIIQELSAKDSRVKGLQFSRNFGQHYSITAGLDHANGDWVVIMDCDLQDRPEEIPRLYSKAQEGFDIVAARRGARKDPFFKRTTSKMFYMLFSLLADTTMDPKVGNFSIISARVVESFRQFREQLRFFGGIIDWMGFHSASIDVDHARRFEGQSTYSFKKLLNLAFHTIIAYSDKPLKLSVGLGFIMSGLSFIYGIYIIIKSLTIGVPVQGWSSLMVSLYFLSGIIIANLGILGIYLGKTFDETKKRPLYIVQRTTDSWTQRTR